MFRILVYYGKRCKTLYLPDVSSQQAELILPVAETGWQSTCHLRFYALDGIWRVCRPEGMLWQDETQEPVDRRLANGFNLAAKHEEGQIGLYCTQCGVQDTVMSRYRMKGQISIGRQSGCDIRLNDEFVSDVHGRLQQDGQEYRYSDSSKNGTYVNGSLICGETVPLMIGDTLSLACGFKLVFYGTFFAVNRGAFLEEITCTVFDGKISYPRLKAEGAYEQLSRPPHFIPSVEPKSWKLEAPPVQDQNQKQPLILTIGPSLTMSLPMLMGSFLAGSGGYAASGAIMMITSSAMAVSWSLINHFYSKNRSRKLFEARMDDYISRVQNAEVEIQACIDEIMQGMLRTYPTTQECCELVAQSSDRIWESVPGAPSFITARVGNGMIKLPYEISVPELKMGEKTEGVRNAPYALKEKFNHLHNAPVTVDFKSRTPLGIIANESELNILQGLLVQLATLNSYTDLRIAVITGEGEGEAWHYLRWLPHTAVENDPSAHMVVSGRSAGQALLNQLNEELACRVENSESGKVNRHYVLFCTDPTLLAQHPFMTNAMAADQKMTVCVIARKEGELPKECKRVLNLPMKTLYDYEKGQKVELQLEAAPDEQLRQTARRLACLRENERTENAAIPTKVTLLESFSVRKVEQLDIWRRWNQNSTGKDISANLGLGAGARPFELNLSDKFHGPHGIVAGTTGSGKSVLLQTLVMSLALNYHPDELQFILIDYKGGGSFDCFKELPHVVGNIDNLQGKRAINRALLSVRGEVMRREAIFKEKGVSDINTYIKRFNHDPDCSPLSHLIIIIDEFAELRDDMPDFMDELISTARIGRSVGLHLILATQKPSASVSAEIWSNSRFHICLRVQTREDSMEMLHRPEAAYIRGMGRGYVQVGNDELFEQIQSSWCGAPYLPNAPASGETPRLLDETGIPLSLDGPKQEAETNELDRICKEITTISKRHGVKGHGPLWLPELAPVIAFEKISESENKLPLRLDIPFGMQDDVENQRYLPAVINLMQDPCLLFMGRSTSGKTTALQTLTYAISRMYKPDEVQVCLMGLSGMMLKPLTALPNVIDYTSGREVKEQQRMISTLATECRRRDELFAAAQTDNYTAYNRERKQQGGELLPALVVMVDRLAQWYELLSDAEQDRLTGIIKGAAGRGLYFVCTAMARNEIAPGLRDSFTYIPMGLDAMSDYADALNYRIPTDVALPQAIPGRGLMKTESGVREFQIALAFGEAADSQRSKRIAEYAQGLDHCVHPTVNIVHVPEVFGPDFLAQTAGKLGKTAPELMPAAIVQQSAEPLMLDLMEKHIVFVYGKHGAGKTSILRALAELRAGNDGSVFVLGTGNEWYSWSRDHHAQYVSVDGDQKAFTAALDDEFRSRLAFRKTHANYNEPAIAREIALKMKPLVLVLDDVERWLEQPRDNGQPYLERQLSQLLGSAISKGANYGICILAGCGASGMTGALPNNTIRQLKDGGWGIAAGNTLVDCNPWNADLPYNRENQSMRAGEGFYVHNESVTHVLLPAGQ